MRAISIRWEFIISFVVIVFLTALVGFLDARATQQVLDEFTEVTDVSAQSVIALTQANTAAFRAQTEAISVAFLGEEAGEAEDEEEEEFAEAVELANLRLEEFSQFRTTDEEIQFEILLRAMLISSSNLIELNEVGAPREELLEQKEVVEDLEDTYEDLLNTLLAQDQARFADSRDAAVATANRSRTVSLSVVGLVAIGSVGIAFFLASQTVTPVIHLKERAIQIARGEDVDEDYSYPNNEVGVLAKEFHDMARQLKTQRDEAMEANAFKTNLLGRVSHELRTPLGAVMGMAGMLAAEEDLRDDHRELVNYILQYSDELTDLIGQILEQSRLERAAADSKLIVSEFDPRDVLTEVRTRLQAQATDKGLDLTVEIDDGLPGMVETDRTKLNQVLNNLVTNAIKFTDKGHVSIRGYSLPDDRWGVDVKDTGMGIADENLGKIFEAFRQGDEEYTRRFGGVGLGLSITRQFVKAMHGEITVTSSPGEGSCFTITLPVKVKKAQKVTGMLS